VPEQGRRGTDGVDQVVGVGAGERGQPGHVITEHVGGDPAEPEHHYRAEYGFLDHADDGLDAAGDHGLDEHSGHPSGEPGLQAAHGGAHLVGPAQVEFDGAGGGLVQQAGHVGLDHHVTAQAGRRLDGRVGIARPAELHHRDAVAAEQVVGFSGGQPATTRHPRQEGIDDRLRVRHAQVGQFRDRAGGPGSP